MQNRNLPGAKSNVLAPIVFRRPSGRLQNLILHASDAAKMQVEPQLADLKTRGRRSHAAGVVNYDDDAEGLRLVLMFMLKLLQMLKMRTWHKLCELI